IDSQKLLSEPRRAVQPRRQQALNSCPLRDLPGGLGDRLSWVGSGPSPRHIGTLRMRRPSVRRDLALEATRRRIVSFIGLFPIAATALFVFRLTKSRKIFYVKIERLCFHTASVVCGHSSIPWRTPRPRRKRPFP